MPKDTKYDGIQGVGTSSLDSAVLEESGQGTFYGGLKVTEDIKNQLMEQEIGSYLRPVQLEDGGYLLKPKLPEKGMIEVGGRQEVYSIRKNYNRIMKGIASRLFDEKGNIDLKHAYEFVSQLEDELRSAYVEDVTAQSLKDLIGYEKLDPQEQADFDTFMGVNECKRDVVRLLQYGLDPELQKAYNYQRILQKGQDEITPEEKTLLRGSAKDYVLLLNRLERMKNMDVDNEYEFYLSSDCEASALMHRSHYKNVMKYRNPDAVATDSETISLVDTPSGENTCSPIKGPENPTAALVNLHFLDKKNGVAANFGNHYGFAFRVNLNGQKKIMTLETSAPPEGKILFNPERGTGGLGIYDDYESFMNCNKASNYSEKVANLEEHQAAFKERIDESSPSITVDRAFIKNSLTQLQQSRRLFYSNSMEYDAMRITVQKITQLNEQIKEAPENTAQLQTQLREQYRILKDVAGEYLESRRGAQSPEGKKRLQLAENLYNHAEKMIDNDEKISERQALPQTQTQPQTQEVHTRGMSK